MINNIFNRLSVGNNIIPNFLSLAYFVAEVRRSLRKKGDSIQCFVNLLNPEEDTVVHEFAALGLSSMAAEFSSKITIYEQNGLEPLIGCLSSHDPDVQKNSIETITLLLQVSLVRVDVIH